MSAGDKIEIYGKKPDGSLELIGTAKTTPPEFKRREIVANHFWEPRGDEQDEAHSCLYALDDYHEWLVGQGWTGPGLEIEPAGKPWVAMKKPKPCTLGPRHKWEWAKNVTVSIHAGGSALRLSAKGRYVCQCGEKKIGSPNHNEPSPLTKMVIGAGESGA